MNNNFQTYSPKCTKQFACLEDSIKILTWDYPVESERKDIICGDLMSGKEFYQHVDSGGIIDYDGSLGNVYVDGYRSNLGLYHKGLCQGGFLVDGPTWLEICETFDVTVEWCNK